MDHLISHTFLVHSPSASEAAHHVREYLRDTTLINYADFQVNVEDIIGAGKKSFETLLAEGLTKNRNFALRMVSHLRKEGVERLEQLLELREGYTTKVLHTLTHMLDGFIGVDSYFYNLIEDSHWISEELITEIQRSPEYYWLVPVQAGELTSSVLHPQQRRS